MSYSERLLQQGSRWTRLAHQSRFDAVLNLLGKASYDRVLDYGCGDGWLLRTAYDRGMIRAGCGVDVNAEMIESCHRLFVDVPAFQFCTPGELATYLAPESCDLLLCTETLEHVHSTVQVVEELVYYGRSGAHVVVSVPIELGPSLLAKQLGRYLTDLRTGYYGYERYTLGELFKAAVLWDVESFPSSHTQTDCILRSHKGFDYRKLNRLLRERVVVERQVFSPFPWLRQFFNSTVIWVGTVR
jgi:SAM-dependent methyltransferase